MSQNISDFYRRSLAAQCNRVMNSRLQGEKKASAVLPSQSQRGEASEAQGCPTAAGEAGLISFLGKETHSDWVPVISSGISSVSAEEGGGRCRSTTAMIWSTCSSESLSGQSSTIYSAINLENRRLRGTLELLPDESPPHWSV